MTNRILATALALAALVPGVGAAAASTETTPNSAKEAVHQAPAPTTIRARNSGQCLKAAGVGDGSAVLQIPCGGWATRTGRRW